VTAVVVSFSLGLAAGYVGHRYQIRLTRQHRRDATYELLAELAIQLQRWSEGPLWHPDQLDVPSPLGTKGDDEYDDLQKSIRTASSSKTRKLGHELLSRAVVLRNHQQNLLLYRHNATLNGREFDQTDREESRKNLEIAKQARDELQSAIDSVLEHTARRLRYGL